MPSGSREVARNRIGEPGSHQRMTEVVREVLPEHRAGVLTGPNLAKEIMAGYAAAAGVSDATIARLRDRMLTS